MLQHHVCTVPSPSIACICSLQHNTRTSKGQHFCFHARASYFAFRCQGCQSNDAAHVLLFLLAGKAHTHYEGACAPRNTVHANVSAFVHVCCCAQRGRRAAGAHQVEEGAARHAAALVQPVPVRDVQVAQQVRMCTLIVGCHARPLFICLSAVAAPSN